MVKITHDDIDAIRISTTRTGEKDKQIMKVFHNLLKRIEKIEATENSKGRIE